MHDCIEKSVDLKASPARVWKALTDYREFGSWFKVKLEGPFILGQVTEGQITYPGYEHFRFQALVRELEPERRFAFDWPHKEDQSAPMGDEVTTRVTFELEKIEEGTRLIVRESGFDKLPAAKRLDIFRQNEEGWSIQTRNIEAYLEKKV